VSIGHSRIAGHTGHGVEASAGTVDLADTTIENNGWSGVVAAAGSQIMMTGNTFIRDNDQHGILLMDTSVLGGSPSDGTRISSNQLYGVLCEPAPAIAQIHSRYSGPGYILSEVHVNGNALGQISCPGIVVR